MTSSDRRDRESEQAIRTLLRDVLRVSVNDVSQHTGLCRATVTAFLAGRRSLASENLQPYMLEDLSMYLWKRMNAHLLLGPEDRI